MIVRFDDRVEGQMFVRLLGGLWSQLARWHERRAMSLALTQLDDRMLRDIGLTRDALRAARVGEPLWAEEGDNAQRPGPALDSRFGETLPHPSNHNETPRQAA